MRARLAIRDVLIFTWFKDGVRFNAGYDSRNVLLLITRAWVARYHSSRPRCRAINLWHPFCHVVHEFWSIFDTDFPKKIQDILDAHVQTSLMPNHKRRFKSAHYSRSFHVHLTNALFESWEDLAGQSSHYSLIEIALPQLPGLLEVSRRLEFLVPFAERSHPLRAPGAALAR